MSDVHVLQLGPGPSVNEKALRWEGSSEVDLMRDMVLWLRFGGSFVLIHLMPVKSSLNTR